jgi:alkylated DNA repair protein (DNA oxidative demethylase)
MRLLPDRLGPAAQRNVLDAIVERLAEAPFYTPRMPRTGKPFSVRMTNFGPLGWVADKTGGYRYQATHPNTGRPWPAIPPMLLDLWDEVTGNSLPPEAFLVNHYAGSAKMGLHQDRDEQDLDAPVLSVSLGDRARFRLGGTRRGGPTQSFILESGAVLTLEGETRLAYHGIDRVWPGTSDLLSAYPDAFPQGGRLNLTLRRVTRVAG